MQTTLSPTLPNRLENMTRRWWFYLILGVLFFLPAYSTLPFDPRSTPQLVIEVLSHALVYSAAWAFPLAKLLPVILLVPLVFGRVRFSRLFLGYAGLNMLLIAVFQDMANTPTYGFAVLTGNLLAFGLVGAALLWSAARGDRLSFQRQPWWRYWVIPPALLAFWFPANTSLPVPAPDFSLARLAGNEAGLTACMMLPVYLAVLALCQPCANRVVTHQVVCRISAFVGLVTGLLNVTEFFANSSYGWWLGVLHLPLLLISIYTLALAFRYRPLAQNEGA